MTGLRSSADPERLPTSASLSHVMPSAYSSASAEDLEPYLARLRPVERDCVVLSTRHGMRQEQIARLLGYKVQGSASYRLSRARRRMQIMRCLPELDEAEMRMDLSAVLEERDALAMSVLWRVHCQQRAAEELGTGQPAVRASYLRATRRLDELTQGWPEHPLRKYRDALRMLGDNRWWTAVRGIAGNVPRFPTRVGVDEHWRWDAERGEPVAP